MSSDHHNTIGPKVTETLSGAPETNWAILDCHGEEVGVIEAEYGDANFSLATRQRRWTVTGYRVWWFDCENEGWFDTKVYETAAKALAAARRYAKGTTAKVRAKWPINS